MFERVAYVYKSKKRIEKFKHPEKPVVGISALPRALECHRLYWEKTPIGRKVLNNYDVFLVNLFFNSLHLKHLRDARPNALIVAMPDPHLEKFLNHNKGITRLKDIKNYCDVIAARTRQAANLYSNLTGVPGEWLPSPIGPTTAYKKYRSLPKKKYILTVDHKSEPNRTMQNIAVLAGINSATNARIVYFLPRNNTKRAAKLTSISNIKFNPRVNYREFIKIIGTSLIGVDMYAAHAQNRHGLAHAIIGTPMVGSMWTNPTGHPLCDPFDTQRAVELGVRLIQDENYYKRQRERGFEFIKKYYSFEAIRNRVSDIIRKYKCK
jgi:hypothetical protein